MTLIPGLHIELVYTPVFDRIFSHVSYQKNMTKRILVYYKRKEINPDLSISIFHNIPNYSIKKDLDDYFNLMHKGNVLLSSREKKILILTANGRTSLEIAKAMYISVNTVNFHIKNALIKLKSKNKTQAVATAILLRLL